MSKLHLSTVKEQFDIDKRLYFVVFCIINIGIVFLYHDFLIKDSMYYTLYGEQVSYERITEFLERREKNQYWIFAFLPLYYVLKFFLISTCMLIGALLYDYKVRFVRLFQIAMFAELVYVLPKLIKFLWFLLFVEDYGLTDLSNFYPQSLLFYLNKKSIEPLLYYPLYLVNIIEFLYWGVLALGLHWYTKKSYGKMIEFVLATYGLGLLLWVSFITFLSVSLS